MTTLAGSVALFAKRHVPRVSVESVQRAFKGDMMLLTFYLENVYGEDTTRVIRDEEVIGMPTTADALLIPVRLGLDPEDKETAEWALFAAERTHFDDELKTYMTRTRFPDAGDLFRIVDAGIPLSYARVVDSEWGQYPTDTVINAWRDGVPAEYLSVTLPIRRDASQ